VQFASVPMGKYCTYPCAVCEECFGWFDLQDCEHCDERVCESCQEEVGDGFYCERCEAKGVRGGKCGHAEVVTVEGCGAHGCEEREFCEDCAGKTDYTHTTDGTWPGCGHLKCGLCNEDEEEEAGACTHPLFSSTRAQFTG